MDPLKPFSTLIRSLWSDSARVEKTRKASGASGVQERTGAATPDAVTPTQALQTRLRSRLKGLDPWDEARARQIFIECVLTSELGDALGNDPSFVAMTQRVGEQLAVDAALRKRLDELLQRSAAGQLVE